jgi:hypothetical protein
MENLTVINKSRCAYLCRHQYINIHFEEHLGEGWLGQMLDIFLFLRSSLTGSFHSFLNE